MESISLQQAKKLVLLSQVLSGAAKKGRAIDSTLTTIKHLGYIQMDTLSVVQRAHHHTLWNRNPRYKLNHIDQLLNEKKIFEYWSHAAAYLPMSDYRFSLYRKKAIRSGQQSHWYKRNHQEMDSVLKRIMDEGPLMARDFDGDNKKLSAWQSKTSKMALENLYMQGDLMVPSRRNFQKVYDLTERVVPTHVDTSVPSSEEYAKHLITRFLRANGIGQVTEMGYLLKGIKATLTSTIKEMLLAGEVTAVKVENVGDYYVLPSMLELLNKPLRRKKLFILSPFDNFLIQRKRMQTLFDYDYSIECYTPESKREYGYFCLPILWGGELVARVDCKVVRNEATLNILHLALEPKLKNIELFFVALRDALPEFMDFNGCELKRVFKVTQNNKSISIEI